MGALGDEVVYSSEMVAGARQLKMQTAVNLKNVPTNQLAHVHRNISRGAVQVSDDLIIGGHADYCFKCDHVLTSDGCTNIHCVDFRKEPFLQMAMRINCMKNMFKVNNSDLDALLKRAIRITKEAKR